jgi:predicted transcriptional regulator
MKRTTVFLYETTECDLKALARQQGRPVADMIREAITDYVSREKAKARRPLRFVAIGRSGHSDTAERHEELLFASPEPIPGSGARPRAKPAAATARRRR